MKNVSFLLANINIVLFVDLYKGDNFCDYLFVSCTKNPFWKGVGFKRKEFATIGENPFFSNRSLFRRETYDRVAAPETVFIPLE